MELNTSSIGGQTAIDGRKQIIEMLRMMPDGEKMALLKRIKEKNPQLAQEFHEKAVSIYQLEHLSDKKIQQLVSFVPSQIMGMALKGLSPFIQKRVLKNCDRSYAEEAYEIMNSQFINQIEKTKRSQEKIIGLITQLSTLS